MVSLEETTLYTGMEYGTQITFSLLIAKGLAHNKSKIYCIIYYIVILYLPADQSRENYRDAICRVMRQLLRKCSLSYSLV